MQFHPDSKSSPRLSGLDDCAAAETDTLLGSLDSLATHADAEKLLNQHDGHPGQTRGDDYDTRVLVATCIFIGVPALTGIFWWLFG